MLRFTSVAHSTLLAMVATGAIACGGLGDDQYDTTAESLTATSHAESQSTLLDVKLQFTGDVAKLKIEVTGDRDGAWKVEVVDAGTQKLNGKTHYTLKAERKDKESGDKSKYSFDYDAHYHDVLVRTSDGVFIGGRIEYDVKAKLSEKTDDTKIKEEWKIKGEATFSESGEGSLVLDESYKYKMKVDGEVVVESRS